MILIHSFSTEHFRNIHELFFLYRLPGTFVQENRRRSGNRKIARRADAQLMRAPEKCVCVCARAKLFIASVQSNIVILSPCDIVVTEGERSPGHLNLVIANMQVVSECV